MKKEELKKYFEELNYDESLQDEMLSYVDNEKDIESLYEKIKFLTKVGVPRRWHRYDSYRKSFVLNNNFRNS